MAVPVIFARKYQSLTLKDDLYRANVFSFTKQVGSTIAISKKYLEVFKKSTALDYDSLAEALSVTRSTLINKKGNEKWLKKRRRKKVF